MQKYGFIYLWYDKKHKKFYLGRHWGRLEDGYICSSNSMRDAYRRRPQDFKRRILKKVFTCNDDLILEEQRWLDMIKPSECGERYYNKTLRSSAPSTRGYKHSDETRKKISEGNKGKVVSEETKQKLRECAKNQFSDVDLRKKLSEKSKSLWKNPDYLLKIKKANSSRNITEEDRRLRSERMKKLNEKRFKNKD